MGSWCYDIIQQKSFICLKDIVPCFLKLNVLLLSYIDLLVRVGPGCLTELIWQGVRCFSEVVGEDLDIVVILIVLLGVLLGQVHLTLIWLVVGDVDSRDKVLGILRIS